MGSRRVSRCKGRCTGEPSTGQSSLRARRREGGIEAFVDAASSALSPPQRSGPCNPRATNGAGTSGVPAPILMFRPDSDRAVTNRAKIWQIVATRVSAPIRAFRVHCAAAYIPNGQCVLSESACKGNLRRSRFAGARSAGLSRVCHRPAVPVSVNPAIPRRIGAGHPGISRPVRPGRTGSSKTAVSARPPARG